MQVNPGSLNKQIQILSILDGETYDDEGIPIHDEKLIRTCWARVTSVSGTELIKAGQELTDAKKRFLVRWTPTEINESHVVRYQGRNHNIVRVNTYSDDKAYVEIWTDDKRGVTEDVWQEPD